jgi:hypothetical protein
MGRTFQNFAGAGVRRMNPRTPRRHGLPGRGVFGTQILPGIWA